MNQTDISRKSGVSQATISQLKSGYRVVMGQKVARKIGAFIGRPWHLVIDFDPLQTWHYICEAAVPGCRKCGGRPAMNCLEGENPMVGCTECGAYVEQTDIPACWRDWYEVNR